jgi:hypothetical protein
MKHGDFMSVKRISGQILSGMLDGKLTQAETEKILSRKDDVWKAPESVGTFVSKREHTLIHDLLDNVKSGEIQADAQSVQMLEDFVAQGPDSRFKHIISGGTVRKSAMKKGAIAAAVPGGAMGALTGFMGWGMHAGVAWGIAGGALLGGVMSGAFALGGGAAGYVAAAIHGALDD